MRKRSNMAVVPDAEPHSPVNADVQAQRSLNPMAHEAIRRSGFRRDNTGSA